MAKVYTEKEQALTDWDNQQIKDGSKYERSDRTEIKLTDEELRVSIHARHGEAMDMAIALPSTKYLTYAMLITVLDAIAANNGDSFEGVISELSDMRVGKKISAVGSYEED